MLLLGTQLVLMGTNMKTRFKAQLRPVTMEGQKFEIHEDPSQTLPERSSMGPMLYLFIFQLSRIPEKTISRGDLGQHLLENFPSRSWIRRGAISCFPHTSFDLINDNVVNSERGELVRGSDPPLVYSAHSGAGDFWRARPGFC